MITQPILLLIFNRPDKTERMIETLRQYKPPKLYIGADGPRNETEKKLTDKTRYLVNHLIDWECEIHQLYRDQNLGLRLAVSGAISWFFDQEEMGIILEDDCLPTSAFLSFADTQLWLHQHNESILHISGSTLLGKTINSYYLSKYPRVWGWASWKRAWKNYDDSDEFLSTLTNKKLKKMYPRYIDKAFWTLIVEKMQLPESSMKKRSWAYFWALNVRAKEALCIQPYQNLIDNQGFGESATNTKNNNRIEYLSAKNRNSHQPIEPKHSELSENIDEREDNQFVDKILIDSKINYLKILLKAIFPFLKASH